VAVPTGVKFFSWVATIWQAKIPRDMPTPLLFVFAGIFVFLLAIAVIMIIMGAFSFVTAGGDPEKTMKARNYIMYAAIGIAVALLAKAVPAMVKMIVGA